MPIIRVEMFEGRDAAKKLELVQALTTEAVRILGSTKDGVHVVITDVAKDNWGVGGELASTKFPD